MAKSAPGGSQATVLGLHPILFYLVWLIVIGFHSVCAFYLIAMGGTYLALTYPENESYAPLWASSGNKHLKAFGAVFFAVAAIHGLQVLYIVFLSIRTKRLVLHCEASKCCKDECKPSAWGFDVAFAAREMVAIGCLSFQAYQSSKLVPRVGFNNLNAAILILACWLTPLLQVLLRKNVALSRALSSLSSFVLCTFLAKVMQALLFISYRDVFNMEDAAFGAKMVYDPTFLAVLAPENRAMFATTVGDFISKLLPFLCSYASLVMLEGVLSRRGEKVTPTSGNASNKVDPNQNVVVETLDGTEGATEPVHLEAGTAKESRPAQVAAVTKNPGCAWPFVVLKLLFVVLKLLFVVWGVLVLAFHLKAQAQHKTTPQGCFSATRPWFSAKVSCLAFVYDCAAQVAMTPTNEAFEAMNFDPEALGSLNFVRCPALMVPSVIQTFPELHSVQIYKSVLYAWGSDAAVTQKFHPFLKSVVLIEVKLAHEAFPEGLMGELPSAMANLQFFNTTLSSVPADLGTKWGVGRTPIGRVGFEVGLLTKIPDEIFQLPVQSLSLTGNNITDMSGLAKVPANTFLPQLSLDLTGVSLPVKIDPTVKIGDLSLENCPLVYALPDWTSTQVLSKMHLYGSTYCKMTTPAQQEKANGICSVSRWGTTPPLSPSERMAETYKTA